MGAKSGLNPQPYMTQKGLGRQVREAALGKIFTAARPSSAPSSTSRSWGMYSDTNVMRFTSSVRSRTAGSAMQVAISTFGE